MTQVRIGRTFRLYLIGSTLALALSACGSSGTTRIASIGAVPDNSGSTGGSGDTGGGSSSAGGNTGGGNTGGSSGGSSSGGGTGTNGTGVPIAGPILVTAGNAVIGLGDKHDALAQMVNGKAAFAGPITGTVTAVLRKSGQTLVDLGNGRSAVLNKAGGAVGKLVTIDLGTGRVIGAPGATGLIGVAALTPTQLASAAINNPVAGTSAGALGHVGTIASNTVGAVTGSPTSQPATLPVVGAITGPLTGSLAGNGTSASGVIPAVVNTTNGVLTTVTGKLPKH